MLVRMVDQTLDQMLGLMISSQINQYTHNLFAAPEVAKPLRRQATSTEQPP